MYSEKHDANSSLEPSVDIQQNSIATPSSSSFHSGKRKGTPHNRDPNSKRPRFNRNSGQGRRGGASYSKTAINPTTLIRPVKTFFEVFVSDEGCSAITEVVYDVIRHKDQRMGYSLPLSLMQYAVHATFYARLLYVGTALGYFIDRETSWLKNTCKSIMLPDVLAQYIESLGYVDIPNGQRIVPFIPQWQNFLLSKYSERLLELLAEHGVGIRDEEHIPDLEIIPRWGLATEVITRYNLQSARCLRMGSGFRTVNFDNPEGRREMLISVKSHPQGIIPCAPFACTIPEAKTGATHLWRRMEDQQDWLLADNHLIRPDFEDSVISPQVVVYESIRDTYISEGH